MAVADAQVEALLAECPFIAAHVEYARAVSDAPLVYHLGGALAMLTQCASVQFTVPFAGGRLKPNLYVMLLGDSANARKTAALNLVKDVLREYDPGCEADRPGSAEALGPMLMQAEVALKGEQARMIIIYDELGNLFLSTKAGSYMERLKTQYTELYDCSPFSRRLANADKPGETVQNPRLSLLGGISPTYLERFTDEIDWTGGFLSRWLIFAAERTRLIPLPGEDPAGRVKLAGWLATIRPYMTAPLEGLTDAAYADWLRWVTLIDTQNRKLPPVVRGAQGRAPAMALRIAMLLQAAEWAAAYEGLALPDNVPRRIGLTALRLAMKIINLHLLSFKYAAVELCGTQYQRWRRDILKLLEGGDRTRVGLAREMRLPARQLDDVLKSMMAEEVIWNTLDGMASTYSRTPPVGVPLSDEPVAGVPVGLITEIPDILPPVAGPAPVTPDAPDAPTFVDGSDSRSDDVPELLQDAAGGDAGFVYEIPALLDDPNIPML